MALIDPTKIKSRRSFSHAATFYSLVADFAHGRLYAGSDDYGIHVFDLAGTGKTAITSWRQHDNFVSALQLVNASSGPAVISASYDHRLIWWDAANGKPLRSVEAHAGWVRSLAATPDRRRLVSAGDDMLVKIW